MVEGELKKRILFPFMCRNHKQWVRRVSARRAIDSAKKDFDAIEKDARDLATKEIKDGHAFGEPFRIIFLKKSIQLFCQRKRKWFGVSE